MQKALDLKSTINLPQTKFSMKANLPQNEPKWLEKWEKEDLYGQTREARKRILGILDDLEREASCKTPEKE